MKHNDTGTETRYLIIAWAVFLTIMGAAEAIKWAVIL